jgi:hypothetical protein
LGALQRHPDFRQTEQGKVNPKMATTQQSRNFSNLLRETNECLMKTSLFTDDDDSADRRRQAHCQMWKWRCLTRGDGRWLLWRPSQQLKAKLFFDLLFNKAISLLVLPKETKPLLKKRQQDTPSTLSPSTLDPSRVICLRALKLTQVFVDINCYC